MRRNDWDGTVTSVTLNVIKTGRKDLIFQDRGELKPWDCETYWQRARTSYLKSIDTDKAKKKNPMIIRTQSKLWY